MLLLTGFDGSDGSFEILKRPCQRVTIVLTPSAQNKTRKNQQQEDGHIKRSPRKTTADCIGTFI